jgi:polysaccharide biosynthesis/export protein
MIKSWIKNIAIIILLFFAINAKAQTNPPFTNPFTNPYGTSNNGTNKVEDKTKKAITDKESKDAKEKLKENNGDVNADGVSSQENKDAEEQNKNPDGEGANVDVKQTAKGGIGKIEVFVKSDIYGVDFFKNSNFTFNDKQSSTPPSSYRLGPGDEIIINIWGPSENQSSNVIGKDGCIYPKYIGKINVQGLRFENAKQLIASKYRQVTAAGSNIDIQLGKSRTLKITMMGEVNKPGTYSISSFNTAFNAISLAGGVTDLANLREIQIRRNNMVVNTIDLYEYLRTGGDLDDTYLEDGDLINIGIYDKKVKAEGSFKRPMYYLLKNDEDLTNLLKLAGGPTFDARFSSIQVQTIINETPKLISINLKDLDTRNLTMVLKDGDVVIVKKINTTLSNTIKVSGSVNYPDMYQIENSEKLLDVIAKAGGLVSDAFTTTAFVYRGDNDLKTSSIKINLANIDKNNPLQNIELFAGDEIMIISKQSFLSKYNVEIMGEVRKPSKLPLMSNLTLKDVLIMSGGLTPEAENGRIEIAHITDGADNYSIKVKAGGNPTIETVIINPNLELDEAAKNIILFPFDKIYVRRKSDYKLMETVSISGEVNFPGEYPLLFPDETISSIINRCGGLKSSAFADAATLSRNPIGLVVINLPIAVKNPKTKNDITLKNGDAIIVPKVNNMIVVRGQVIKPINVLNDGTDYKLLDYISMCGGFGERPWKDRISVQYANGKNKSTKRIFFVRHYPKVLPGSIVTIPQKPIRKEYDFSWRDTQSIMGSVLTTMGSLTTAWAIIKSIPKTP